MNNKKTVVAIEQPSFFPWCGYIGLICVSDIYVFYDDVQFERRSWQSRNRILSPDKDWMYINVPTIKAPRESKINQICVVEDDLWKKNLLSKIKNVYRNTAYFNKYYGCIEKAILSPCQKLVDLNIRIILLFCELIGIDAPRFILSSNIKGICGTKTDRLINIMKELGESIYISGSAAKAYIDAEKFRKEGIELFWYEFVPKEYKQQNIKGFVPYMSVIDALFHLGAFETKKYIEEIAYQSISKHSFAEK